MCGVPVRGGCSVWCSSEKRIQGLELWWRKDVVPGFTMALSTKKSPPPVLWAETACLNFYQYYILFLNKIR